MVVAAALLVAGILERDPVAQDSAPLQRRIIWIAASLVMGRREGVCL